MENIRPKVKNFIRLYENQEIESMNYIFNKNTNNNWFTQEELAFANQVDLFNKVILDEVKESWVSRNFE